MAAVEIDVDTPAAAEEVDYHTPAEVAAFADDSLLLERLPEESAHKLQAAVDPAASGEAAAEVQQHIAAYTAVVVVEEEELEHHLSGYSSCYLLHILAADDLRVHCLDTTWSSSKASNNFHSLDNRSRALERATLSNREKNAAAGLPQ